MRRYLKHEGLDLLVVVPVLAPQRTAAKPVVHPESGPEILFVVRVHHRKEGTALPITGQRTGEPGVVVPRRHRLIPREVQFQYELTASDRAILVDVWNAAYDQMTGHDVDVIAFLHEPAQIRTTPYRLL